MGQLAGARAVEGGGDFCEGQGLFFGGFGGRVLFSHGANNQTL